ncbi:Ig-like domain-containing protein, partial [Gemmatimonadota bacterium]
MKTRFVANGLLLFLVQACSDSTSSPVPSSVVVTPSNASLDALGLTQQFSAEVRTKKGKVIPDVAVTWSSSNQAVATVTPQGMATGVAPGTTSIRASIEDGISGSGNLRIDPAPAELIKVAGDGQTGAILQALSESPMVEVRDSRDHPIPGIQVNFRVVAGAGSVSSSFVTTGPDGRASAAWTLGCSDDDPQRLEAKAGGFTAEFQASADLSVPAICLESVPDGRETFPYSAQLEAVGGDQGSLAWSVSDGSLPPGLALAADGTLSGIPGEVGSFLFQARVEDALGQWAARDFGLRVCEGPLVLTRGESLSLAPSGSSGCGFFLPSGDSGDRYRVGVVYASPDTSSLDTPFVTVSITRENPLVGSPGATAFRLSTSDEGMGSGQDWVPALPKTFLEEAHRVHAREALHHLRLERDATLVRELVARGARPLTKKTSLFRSSEGPQTAAPEKLSLQPNEGGTCEASGAVTAVKILEDERLVMYQDSTQNATSPVATDHAEMIFDFYRDFGEEIIDTYFDGVTDINDDGQVVVFVTPIVSEDYAAWVWPGDFFEKSSCDTSNEMEIVYFSNSVIGRISDGGYQALGTMVHEMKHVSSLYRSIGRFFASGQTDPGYHPTWIEEGTAEIASEMASRLAWASVGGPDVGEMVDANDIRTQAFDAEGGVKKEAYGVLFKLLRTTEYLSSQPNG